MNKEKIAKDYFDKQKAKGHYELSDTKSEDYYVDGFVAGMEHSANVPVSGKEALRLALPSDAERNTIFRKVSVKDRLPKKDGKYLTSNGERYFHIKYGEFSLITQNDFTQNPLAITYWLLPL